jgi:hypothetical protein
MAKRKRIHARHHRTSEIKGLHNETSSRRPHVILIRCFPRSLSAPPYVETMQTFTRQIVARNLAMEDDCDGYTLLDTCLVWREAPKPVVIDWRETSKRL